MVTFKDIPRFTKTARYEVCVTWDYLEEQIDRYVSKYGLDTDPDFQRAHVWTPTQQVRYVEYILRGGKSSRTLYFNHPGWMSSFEGEFVLVDGKQRLEAAMAFLRGDIPAFGHYRKEYTDTPFEAEFVFAINDLKRREQVLQWYLDLNDGGVVHTSEELNKVREMLAKEKGAK